MKILILSCYTGEGHNSAAFAVKEALERFGVTCVIADPVLFRSKRAQKFVSSFYNGMIKNVPSTFGILYKAGVLYDSTGITSPVYYANASYAQCLYQYITENGFDAVISTHLYGMEALTAIKRKAIFDVPFYGVLTDYTLIPFLAETKLDGYFVPHKSIEEKLISRGVPRSNIYTYGIPVSGRFNRHMPRSAAREKLKIEQDKKMILVMSGGIGGINLIKLCDELVESTDINYRIFAMTGRNESLKNEIDKRYNNLAHIQAVPFTRDINLYMNSANVLLTKPGGLSSTEAAVANIPIIHVNAIPGCETKNAAFFENHGMSYNAKNTREAVRYALALTENENACSQMIYNQKQNINPNAAYDIAKRVARI